MKKLFLLILVLNSTTLLSQTFYKYSERITRSKLEIKNTIFLKNNLDSSFNWIDCNLSDTCYKSNAFIYKLIDSSLYFTSTVNGISISHLQFSLKGDTIDYMDEEQSDMTPSIIGKSFYEKDTHHLLLDLDNPTKAGAWVMCQIS